MKLELSCGLLRFILRTESRGCSATLCLDDADTRVTYGGLHACVTLLDLGIEVEMNPDPGEWKDADWARATALRAVCDNMTPELLQQTLVKVRQRARQDGAKQARKTIRKALGIGDSNV